jgi:hypothetical protein
MRDFKSKLAREVNRLTGWSGPVFERRYEMTVVTSEDRAQIERLSYVLAQSVKEGLVEEVREWPGVHSAAALIEGTPLEGHWFDRTREYAARNQREEITRLQFAEEESVILSPIPCWAHLPPDVYRARIAGIVETFESEAARLRSLNGTSVLGVEAILAKDPQHRPESIACSPAPLVHAATKAARKAFYDAYAWGSSPPSGKPPRNCGRATATLFSRPAASHRLCRSWRDSPLACALCQPHRPSQGDPSEFLKLTGRRCIRTDRRGLPNRRLRPAAGRFRAAQRLRRQPIDVLTSGNPGTLPTYLPAPYLPRGMSY